MLLVHLSGKRRNVLECTSEMNIVNIIDEMGLDRKREGPGAMQFFQEFVGATTYLDGAMLQKWEQGTGNRNNRVAALKPSSVPMHADKR